LKARNSCRRVISLVSAVIDRTRQDKFPRHCRLLFSVAAIQCEQNRQMTLAATNAEIPPLIGSGPGVVHGVPSPEVASVGLSRRWVLMVFMPAWSLETLQRAGLPDCLSSCGAHEYASCHAFLLSVDDQNENDCRSCGTSLLAPFGLRPRIRALQKGTSARLNTFKRSPSRFFLEVFDTRGGRQSRNESEISSITTVVPIRDNSNR
jgi:hypothetical protein